MLKPQSLKRHVSPMLKTYEGGLKANKIPKLVYKSSSKYSDEKNTLGLRKGKYGALPALNNGRSLQFTSEFHGMFKDDSLHKESRKQVRILNFAF